MVAPHLALPATNDLSAALQKGLFEEEANHDLNSAIVAYQSAITQFDENRKLAATALFRLGECHRKQGDTNAAKAQYERVLREFADQTQLATLSRSYLAASGQTKTLEAGGLPSATSAEAEEVHRIQALIKDSPDLINSPSDRTSKTLLESAAAKGELAIVSLLLDNDAAVNGVKQLDLTPLHYATGNGHKAVVDLLLSRGAKADARTESGLTPLHLAALKGYELVARTLLDAGAPVNARLHNNAISGDEALKYSLNSGDTPLFAAVKAGYPSLVELLLSKGADVNIQDGDGRTPLSHAVQRRDEVIAKVLLAAHADPNAGRLILPLHMAAWNGDMALLEALLSKGANPNTNSTVNWWVGSSTPPGGIF